MLVTIIDSIGRTPHRPRHVTALQMIEISKSDNFRQANLRHLLNQWDPIGVADLVDDEYDCLLAPLWNRLIRGVDRASLSEYLWFQVQEHFGLDPERCATDALADRLLALAATWTDR